LNLPARYNVAPSQDVPVVRNRHENDGTGRELVMMRWGLVPFWAKDAKIGYRCINARLEDMTTSPAFSEAFKWRRCLVLADSFFEWKKLDAKTKQPYRVMLKSGAPFAFAGLWEFWKKGKEQIISCTIITGPPNELAAPIHDRMPVILPPEYFDGWLSGKARTDILKPYPAQLMRAYPVGTRVNSPKNVGAAIIEPLATYPSSPQQSYVRDAIAAQQR